MTYITIKELTLQQLRDAIDLPLGAPASLFTVYHGGRILPITYRQIVEELVRRLGEKDSFSYDYDKLQIDTGGGCSVCGNLPVVNVHGTYWLCGPCVFARYC